MMNAHLPRRGQRGMSLVELMVGVAIGLIIVAAATVMAASQLTENRKLLLDTQIQQDMRATMDIVTREVRRAGHNASVLNMVWDANQPEREPDLNTFAGPTLPSADRVDFQYDRARLTATGPSYSYFLDTSRGVIMSQTNTATPEPLTDENTMRVTEFTIEREPVDNPYTEHLTCPKLCADGSENCWPTFTTHDLKITMKARSAADSTITREMVTRVRPRNAAPKIALSATRLCPP